MRCVASRCGAASGVNGPLDCGHELEKTFLRAVDEQSFGWKVTDRRMHIESQAAHTTNRVETKKRKKYTRARQLASINNRKTSANNNKIITSSVVAEKPRDAPSFAELNPAT